MSSRPRWISNFVGFMSCLARLNMELILPLRLSDDMSRSLSVIAALYSISRNLTKDSVFSGYFFMMGRRVLAIWPFGSKVAIFSRISGPISISIIFSNDCCTFSFWMVVGLVPVLALSITFSLISKSVWLPSSSVRFWYLSSLYMLSRSDDSVMLTMGFFNAWETS